MILYLVSGDAARGKAVSEILDWPPVFERLIGDPEVVCKEKSPSRGQVQWIRPLNKVIVFCPDLCDERAESILIDYFLEKVWREYLSPASRTAAENRYEMKEIVPVSRQDYFRIGRSHLAGGDTGCAVYDAWWRVRMGCDLSPSRDYLLGFNTLAWAEKDGIPHGHFSFALRRRGGDPDGDMIFDFRFSWYKDRRTKASDMFGKTGNCLQSFHENYYDWLDTQTAFRHCDIFTIFVPVSNEQVTLLKAYKGGIHKVTKYKLFKNNCASLGLQFVNRLLPLDERVERENSFWDFPARKISLATGSFGETVAEVEFASTTLLNGRDFTHNNVTRKAEPGRRECEVYQKLASVRAINQP